MKAIDCEIFSEVLTMIKQRRGNLQDSFDWLLEQQANNERNLDFARGTLLAQKSLSESVVTAYDYWVPLLQFEMGVREPLVGRVYDLLGRKVRYLGQTKPRNWFRVVFLDEPGENRAFIDPKGREISLPANRLSELIDLRRIKD